MKKYRIVASISDSGVPNIECQELSFLFNIWNTMKVNGSGDPAIFHTLKEAREFMEGKEYSEYPVHGLADKIRRIEKKESLDERYIRMARIWAENSYCERRKVGALIVKDGSIISDGYNGTPSGFENECECGGKTKPYVLHAEANAITKLAKDTRSAIGATLYITTSPCVECAKLVIQAGIKRVVYDETYRDTSGIDLLKRAGIKVEGRKEWQHLKVISMREEEGDSVRLLGKEKCCAIVFSGSIRDFPCKLTSMFGELEIEVRARDRTSCSDRYICFVDRDACEKELKSLTFKIQ